MIFGFLPRTSRTFPRTSRTIPRTLPMINSSLINKTIIDSKDITVLL